MNRRPLSVTIIGWLFIAVGTIGIAYHSTEFNRQAPFDFEVVSALLVRGLAIVCGAFLIKGVNWARWLLIGWMALHVVLSLFHSLSEKAMHVLVLAVIGFLLFRLPAAAYFRRG